VFHEVFGIGSASWYPIPSIFHPYSIHIPSIPVFIISYLFFWPFGEIPISWKIQENTHLKWMMTGGTPMTQETSI
jgi:hypothetical protein